MKHFELVEWTDFVRGLVEESARVAMEHHLASGCRKCRHTAELLHKAEAAARSDSKVQVPEYVVRQAGKRIEMLLTQPIGRTTREGRAGAKKALSARKEQ